MNLNIYLSGEIHTDWRQQIIDGVDRLNLPINIYQPVTDHELSDDIGDQILGKENSKFWKDHKSAKINNIRIRTLIKQSDIVIIKFGEQYRQWNAAFDAGYAVAEGKSIITIHPDDAKISHALKEIDSFALAVCYDTDQVIKVLQYVVR